MSMRYGLADRTTRSTNKIKSLKDGGDGDRQSLTGDNAGKRDLLPMLKRCDLLLLLDFAFLANCFSDYLVIIGGVIVLCLVFYMCSIVVDSSIGLFKWVMRGLVEHRLCSEVFSGFPLEFTQIANWIVV
ncbi:hypothetical protein QVD17_35401 [Tagetes erecta]|uniref:Uncharacterized protein n=1 Tax=Tagetes erecta TaxID=13708 RepID=A0AAD8NF55_TARER|nr:hypothetical protein QVD17_35401 [Tagetes erecta]